MILVPEKKDIPVVVYTRHHRIEGMMTLLKGERFSDRLNISEKKFESLSNAHVFGIEKNTLVHEAPYLAVNKDQIVLIIPAESEA